MTPTPPAAAPVVTPYVYHARVDAIHDGDTLTAYISLGFEIAKNAQRIRLLGLNCPELNTPAGKAAQRWLAAKILGKWVILQTEKDHDDKFGGRKLGRVWLGGECINQSLIAAGHAAPWDGQGPKPLPPAT